MKNKPNSRKPKAQVFDLYYEMLIRDVAMTLDTLLALCPDEPIGPPEGAVSIEIPGVRKVLRERRHWPEEELLRHELYPGYQPGAQFRRRMKRDNLPDAGALLVEFIRARLRHAKADWSCELKLGWTTKQFRDWLPLYVDWESVIWPKRPEEKGWSEALQIIRLACGLPRFAPSWKMEEH